MKRLAQITGKPTGEIFSETAQRLVRWGCSEGQAHVLAGVITLSRETPDADVESAVTLALVNAKHAVDGLAEVQLIAGRRCDVQRRLEGRE